MKREFELDMQRVMEGSLSRDEAAEIHGAASVGDVLSLHDRLSELSSVEVDVAPWYLVAPRLSADPTRRRGRRAAAVSVAAALVLIPAAAEAIEAIATRRRLPPGSLGSRTPLQHEHVRRCLSGPSDSPPGLAAYPIRFSTAP